MSSIAKPVPNHFSGNSHRSTTPNKQVVNASNAKGPHMVLLNQGNPNIYQGHWKSRCRETVVTVAANGILNLPIVGGSDNGEFAYLGYLQQEKIHYVNGRLESGDILLEIQGQKVVGYTQRDVVAWLNHCCRNGNAVILRVTDAGTLTKDLRQYLNTRFLKGSADHDLQNTIRDNLYLRTVPCTTRPKRDGEVDGVDYTFLTLAEFLALERSGNLLESGIYEGNHYGTPKPPCESPLQCPLVRSIANGIPPHPQHHSILPGAHPSSEGKRRRNRSNVEAMASKSMDPDAAHPPRSHTPSLSSLAPSINNSLDANNVKDSNLKRDPGTPPELGPLSSNWEKAYTENGEAYFIDHSSGTSQWLDPRLARVQKKAIEDCADDELPYGWEKIDDPQFGTYYIDHINRQTQYENPVWQAKRVKEEEQTQTAYGEGWEKIVDPQHGTYYIDHNNQQIKPSQNKRADEIEHQPKAPIYNGNGIPNSNAFDEMPNMAKQLPNFPSNGKLQNSDGAGPPSTQGKPHTHSGLNAYFPCLSCLSDTREECGDTSPSPQLQPTEPPNPAQFTRNPSELRGTFITSILVKSSRGFGFTIVGGDDEVEEFLQIKSVVPEGPAWQEGKLAQGDILVYVDDTCVLGFTHRDVVTMFQNIPVGDEVTLEVCRGYPLPFDPNDPNTEIVTTLAVSADDSNAMDPHRPPPPPPLPLATLSSNLSRQDENGEDLEMGSGSAHRLEGSETPDILEFYGRNHNGPVPLEVLTVGIVKGLMGFGFTIADSAHGQKVKKILDRPRCKNLAEGDVLLEINNKDVRGLEHAHVVQFLKDCAQGLEATITIQRGGQSSKSRAKAMKAAKSLEDNAMPRKEDLGKSQERHFNSVFSKSFDGGMPPMGPYRSKTPTADLYGSHREKEIVPNRPKTPLVDTRNRPKTPTLVTANGTVRPKTPSMQDQALLDHRTQGGILTNSSVAPVEVIGGATHPNNSGALGPGSLYARDGRYPESADDWQSGKVGRGYGERPMLPERGRIGSGDSVPNHDDRKAGALHGSSQLPNWSMEAKQQEENYYGYEHGQGDGEGSVAFSLNNRSFVDQDHHFQHHSPGEPPAVYSSQARNNPYGSNYGVSGQNASHYGTTTNNNSPSYNTNSYPDGGGSGNMYEVEYGTHYSAPHLRKQGTSFEREQPSPVNHVARKVNSWYVGQPEKERNQSFSPAFPINHNAEYMETTITLYKQETGFGFRIVGGTEEGSQVSIGHIVPGGAADLDGRLKSGDEITLVDNQSVLHTSHHHVVQLMGVAAHSGRVTLGIRRRLQPRDAFRGKSLDGVYPYDVTVVRRENEGFGFVIISSVTRAGSTIGRIIENSPAERCGHLHVGDRILAVNGKDIMNLHHGEIVNFIKDSGFSVTLTIGPPQDDTSSTTSASQRNSNLSVISALALPVVGECSESQLRRRNMCSSTPCLPLGYHDSFPSSRPTPTCGGNNNGEGGGGYYPRKSNQHRYSYYSTRNSMGKSLDAWQQEEGALDDEQYYAVELLRGTRGFGFSIRGGREFHNMALFVLRIAEDGPAARDGRLRRGDQIVEINGINTKDMTHADAIDLIKQGGTAVRLLIKRGTEKMPPYGSHPTLPLDHRGGGGTNNQSQVISPVLAGSFPTSGSGGYLPANASNASSHLSSGLHNGPLGQSSPRVLMAPDRDPYYSQWEYERGPV